MECLPMEYFMINISFQYNINILGIFTIIEEVVALRSVCRAGLSGQFASFYNILIFMLLEMHFDCARDRRYFIWI